MLNNSKNDLYWELLKKYDYFGLLKIKSLAKQLTNLTTKEVIELTELTEILKSECKMNP
jgi:hypothetical protein